MLRGIGRDADVVLEVINGITFLTPLWLRKPRVAMVHHVHRDLYMGEFPRTGAAAVLAPRALAAAPPVPPHALPDDLELRARRPRGEGIPDENITVEYLGVDPGSFRRGTRAPEPRLLFVGRLKAYKRIEPLLDVLEAVPGAMLDIVGEGDHRAALEAEIERRGLAERVAMHGYVDDETKAELYGRAWVALTASSSEGWSLTVMEAALCGTPSAALAVGGLPESIVDGETGSSPTTRPSSTARVREVVERPDLRERFGAAAERRARTFTWERVAEANLEVLRTGRRAAAGRGRAARRGESGDRAPLLRSAATWRSGRMTCFAARRDPGHEPGGLAPTSKRPRRDRRRRGLAERGPGAPAVGGRDAGARARSQSSRSAPSAGAPRSSSAGRPRRAWRSWPSTRTAAATAGPQEITPERRARRGGLPRLPRQPRARRRRRPVRHVRLMSSDALGEVHGPDRPALRRRRASLRPRARDDIEAGAPASAGRRRCSSTTPTTPSASCSPSFACSSSRAAWRYVGRTRSLAEYRREDLSGRRAGPERVAPGRGSRTSSATV